MSKKCCFCFLFLTLVFAGCKTTRPISDSGYEAGRWGHSNFSAELSEFDIIGSAPGEKITEENLAAVVATPYVLSIKKDARILLIQSGAFFPDEPMQRELEKFLKVSPFSGMAPGRDEISMSLRQVALKGGYDYIVCYWGVLETEQKNLATKSASWTPVVGKFIPDETQNMRIRLKMIVLDAHTGNWTMLLSEPESSTVISTKLTRRQKDQGQVETLKQKGYAELAAQLQKYVEE